MDGPQCLACTVYAIDLTWLLFSPYGSVIRLGYEEMSIFLTFHSFSTYQFWDAKLAHNNNWWLLV